MPTDAQRKVLAEYRGRLLLADDRWGAAQQRGLLTLNRALSAAGIAQIHVPSAAEVRVGESPEAKDLP
jgi:hypothetical protein